MNEITDFSTSYEERDAQDIDRLVAETRCAIEIAFNNVEYLLGNGDFEENGVDFREMEDIYQALSNISQAISDEQYEEITER